MKVNFNKAFRAYNGEDATEDKEVIGKDGKKSVVKEKQMISEMVAMLLYGGQGLVRSGDTDKDNKNKFAAYKLSQRVILSKGAIEITPEEAVLIKQVASHLTAGGYGQIVELIDGKE